MEKPYFIMMYNQKGNLAMPIIESDEFNNEFVVFFKTMSEAKNLADNHYFCKAFGYKIFKMD
jgi:hypothetical protein